jgi:hypothetical protein
MGEWKISITTRVRPTLRAELMEIAAGEQRSLGNLTANLLEWGFGKSKVAGTTTKLLGRSVSK